jgi:hypothetical protein
MELLFLSTGSRVGGQSILLGQYCKADIYLETHAQREKPLQENIFLTVVASFVYEGADTNMYVWSKRLLPPDKTR